MTLTLLAVFALAMAAIPCRWVFRNRTDYRPAPSRPAGSTTEQLGRISVLVPARNEEHNIRATVQSILASRGVEFEVILLDDQSTDRTAEIARELASADSRLRLESAPPLPAGWCGKQHACHVLSTLPRHPLLVFLDADVRLTPDALERTANFLEISHVDLASGIPRQETVTFSERLLIPLVHFILLGFLPLHRMRRSNHPALAAGCGQLILVLTLLAVVLAYLPRLLMALRFGQSFGSALLHPLGVIGVLAIQWYALARWLLGCPAYWKGRNYGTVYRPSARTI